MQARLAIVAARWIVGVLLACSVLTVQACRATAPVTPGGDVPPLPPTVVLISIDGWRWDYHTKAPVPHLQRLMDRGVRAEGLVPVFPSKTFPNHYTIVTGLTPDHHGVIGNNMLDPATGGRFSLSDREAQQDPRWWGGEPLWATATRQGQRAATLFWPGSEAPIGGIRAADWLPYDGSLPNESRIDRVLEWLDRPPATRPTFITTYISDIDTAGHTFGPDSPEVMTTIGRMDTLLGRLVAGLEARRLLAHVNIVLVSDHGMASASLDRMIALSDYLDLATVDVVELNPNLGLVPKGASVDEVYRRLKDAHPHLRVYRREETPAHWRFRTHPRIQPIVGVADEGWTITRRPVAADLQARLSKGHHGYDSTARSMHGLFVAAGPAFRRGVVVPAFENIHIYNVLARVLGVTPAENDGDPRVARSLLAPR